ncbi:NMD3 family protein [Nannochloropsis gaditana]|uniref:60S ribosomal export protein NMD3 n=2 Tax=Nannochloropsis gaditana TaxID=72520 RepID=W7TLL9_9STRA|nr:NMD3 family protein [Nannochloropsis gaditana]
METTAIPLTRTAARVLCPLCGLSMESNAANRCGNCVRNEIDLQGEIKPSRPLIQCKQCFHWQAKSKHWVAAELESRELLALVLKFVPGLHKGGSGPRGGDGPMEVVEAGWIWTEPHSKRLKLKLTVRKEVLNGVMVQQRVQAEFVVRTIQCDACALSYTEQAWKAVCQLRQRVTHKRTFFFLEQLLLARKMESKILDMELTRHGMDLYFGDKNTALQFLAFLQTAVPMRSKTTRKLIAEDRQNNVHRSQWSMSVDIVPLCKDDLCFLPPGGGGVQGLVLVSRVTAVVQFLDPLTLKTGEMTAAKYWKAPVECLMQSGDLIPYEVLDVELIRPRRGEGKGGRDKGQRKAGYPEGGNGPSRKWQLAEVEIIKSSDFGVRDVTHRVVSHLGHLLAVGDTVLGYDLGTATALGEREGGWRGMKHEPPDVVLVRRVDVEKKGAKRERRRLRRLQARRARRAAEREGNGEGAGARGRDRKEEVEGEEKAEADFLAFAEELEEDLEMQALIAREESAARQRMAMEEEGEGWEEEERGWEELGEEGWNDGTVGGREDGQ